MEETKLPDDEVLASMPFDKIEKLRGLTDDMETEKKLAPYHHRAFAREMTQELPWLAIPTLPFAIPGYQAAKAVGAINEPKQTPPSWDQVTQGYKGYWEGLPSHIRQAIMLYPQLQQLLYNKLGF